MPAIKTPKMMAAANVSLILYPCHKPNRPVPRATMANSCKDSLTVLVCSLPQTGAIFSRFGGINGSAYLVGGFGMTALTGNKMVVVSIRSGIGLRLGANLGWLKFTDSPTSGLTFELTVHGR